MGTVAGGTLRVRRVEWLTHEGQTLPMADRTSPSAPLPARGGQSIHTTGVIFLISLRKAVASRRIFRMTFGELRVEIPLVRGK